jgi:Fe2+ or Zn2+ uptake regulation protein
VYRTIKLLLDAGIIQRLPLDDEQGVYHLVYGRRPSDMIIRTDTREMIPLELPELATLVERACRVRGLALKGHRLCVFAEGSRAAVDK